MTPLSKTQSRKARQEEAHEKRKMAAAMAANVKYGDLQGLMARLLSRPLSMHEERLSRLDVQAVAMVRVLLRKGILTQQDFDDEEALMRAEWDASAAKKEAEGAVAMDADAAVDRAFSQSPVVGEGAESAEELAALKAAGAFIQEQAVPSDVYAGGEDVEKTIVESTTLTSGKTRTDASHVVSFAEANKYPSTFTASADVEKMDRTGRDA